MNIFICYIFTFAKLAFFDYFLLSCISSGTSYALNQMFGDCGFSVQVTKSQENVQIQIDEDEEMQFVYGENEE